MVLSNTEITPVQPDDDIVVDRDTRRPYERQLAVYLILASSLFSLAALYSLDINVTNSLSSNKVLNWTHTSSSYMEYTFDGKQYINQTV